MTQFNDIHAKTPDGMDLPLTVAQYITAKNLNFIVAEGRLLNQRATDLGKQDVDRYMAAFSACAATLVPCLGQRPSPPFLAARTDGPDARVAFLIDLTCEACDGRAGKFYSKILGALSTQVFAAHPGISRLFFPFELEDTLGRGLSLDSCTHGTWIVKV